ncbi:MAG: hydroxyquinol 1,2-dioxygenase [Hyphomicrobiales bacterium]|jgi:hydroxyquinol 1,2-dioxygenase|nr:hydroxyquinol 1,2-dioxygenase [Hyphomicrobiales bacterium]MBV8321067.1 hydroxyquinol 1,2-dioxygenase [Hyphomicrobiales bacterium]MBV8419532.1 hydroxyquinol 1,2-dioxygenase [Hyphomicrobiales bacterium]
MPYVTEDNLTDVAMERWKDIPDPRLRQIMQSLIKHLHGFVRDIEPTQAEWAAAIDWLTRTGKLCSPKRQEFVLASDVLGVSMLVDAINHRRPSGATPSTVEGPFHVPDAPAMANGADMAQGAPGIPCFVTGTVRGLNGDPLAGAVLDLWQTDGEGLYEDQRDVTGPWMRGLYRAQPDGSYAIRTVAPIAYTIPMDGTVGELMNRTNISHMRPAHIHFAVSAPGYHGLITHLFQKNGEYLDTDVVYAVKEPLIVNFVKKPPGKAPTGETVATPFYEVKYDFVLEKRAQALAAAE